MLRPPGVGFVSLHEVRVQFEVLLSRANPDLFSIYWDLPSPRTNLFNLSDSPGSR